MQPAAPSAGYRELAQHVEALLAGGGALVPARTVHDEVAHRLRHLVSTDADEPAAAADCADLARAIAAYLGPRQTGCVICGACGLQLMAADATPTRFAPPAKHGVRDFSCPCGARYRVAVADLDAFRRDARGSDRVIRLGPEDAAVAG